MNWIDDVFHYALSDVGVKRSHNQDAFGVARALNKESWETRGHLFLVADGMGAHAVGELASKIAVDTIRHTYAKIPEADPSRALHEAIAEANHTIHQKGLQNPEFKGMGTTATALALLPDGARVGHVGDSRCYRIRTNRIDQLSFDHSLQWEIARRQQVQPSEVTSIPSNIIIRSLGPEQRVRIDVSGPYPVEEGDKFLLCSDGLSGPVSDKELWAVATFLPGEEACHFLVDLANLRGGPDNITVVLVQVGDPSKQAAAELAPSKSSILFQHAKQWARWIGGPGWLLIAGLAMSGISIVLKSSRSDGVRWTAMLALLMWTGALVWLMTRRHKQEEKAAEPPPPPPPVHRTLDCSLERPLVENLGRAEKQLHELAIEEAWRVDWGQVKSRRASAEQSLRAGDFPEAFREYCRAVSLLCSGLREHRDKHEVFMPHWQRDE